MSTPTPERAQTRAEALRAPTGCPVDAQAVNELGPIAPSYDRLHRVDLIGDARSATKAPQASYESTVCAALQAAEVGVLNLTRIAIRTATAVNDRDFGRASRLVDWSVGFHRLLRRLGTVVVEARSLTGNGVGEAPRVSIAGTAGYLAYVEELHGLHDVVRCVLLVSDFNTVRTTIATKSIDDPLYRVLHGIRLGSHDATKWEADLSGIPLDLPGELDDVLATAILARAVAVTELNPATLHGEFVALHQIPEILCAEANDHLEAAVRALREGATSRVVLHLALCNDLLWPMVEAQRVMAELLATGEYHGFRENLGPASGTHSLAVKQHMFKDLFKHFWATLETWLETQGGSVPDAIAHVDRHAHDGDADAWLRQQVLHQAFRLQNAHQEWRHEHLHMPRNCLGSGGTKSMIGVPDGPQAVYKMRDAANANRSLQCIYAGRGMSLANEVGGSPLSALTSDPASVDAELMRAVGEATRDYFPEVQEQSYQPFHSGEPERIP